MTDTFAPTSAPAVYYVLTTRSTRVAASPGTDRYAPRYSTRISHRSSGPFSDRQSAESAARAALGVQGCLAAEILTLSHMRAIVARGGHSLHGERSAEFVAIREVCERADLEPAGGTVVV